MHDLSVSDQDNLKHCCKVLCEAEKTSKKGEIRIREQMGIVDKENDVLLLAQQLGQSRFIFFLRRQIFIYRLR